VDCMLVAGNAVSGIVRRLRFFFGFAERSRFRGKSAAGSHRETREAKSAPLRAKGAPPTFDRSGKANIPHRQRRGCDREIGRGKSAPLRAKGAPPTFDRSGKANIPHRQRRGCDREIGRGKIRTLDGEGCGAHLPRLTAKKDAKPWRRLCAGNGRPAGGRPYRSGPRCSCSIGN
jgi:hypothetical protein